MNWNKITANDTLQNICLCGAYPEIDTRYKMAGLRKLTKL